MKKLLTFCILLYTISIVKSQWNSNFNENLLTANPGTGGASFSARMSDGKTYIGFWKRVAAPVNFELRLQILDQNGFQQLGSDGILLSNQIAMGSYTYVERTTVDSSDNLYIGVTGTGAGTPGYVFKVTPQGTSAWPNGINLGEGYLPTILPLSNGDIVVSYWPSTQKYTKVQRFNSAGQPVWALPVQILSDDSTKNTVPADLFELPNNEFEVIFSKVTTGTNSYLFAQKLNLSGGIVWSAPVQIATKTTSWNIKYQGVVDGNVVYYGFSSGQAGRFDGYLQRVNMDGTLPWGVAGVDFDTNQTYYEKDMKIAFASGSPYIWSIANYSDSAQGQNGEFVQKFDKNTGNRLFTNNAKQVFPVDTNSIFHTGSLHLLDDKPFFVVQKKIGTSSVNISLNAVLLDNNGDFTWSQNYLPMATFAAGKSYITSLKPINGQSVLVFQEQKTTDSNPVVYAQNLVLPTLNVDESVGKQSFTIYPNPAVDVINIKEIKDQEYSIFNTVGQIVQSGKIKQGKINVQELLKGIYFLKISNKNEGFKFIKK